MSDPGDDRPSGPREPRGDAEGTPWLVRPRHDVLARLRAEIRDAERERDEQTGRAAKAEAAVERTRQAMERYSSQGIKSVNVRQVLNLLSPTWPDGNFEGGTDAYAEAPGDLEERMAEALQMHTASNCAGCGDPLAMADWRKVILRITGSDGKVYCSKACEERGPKVR